MTTLKAKGAFPENHPLSVGVRGAMTEHFLRKADVLFSIGSSLFPNRFSHAIPDAEAKTIVQCTVDVLDINRSYETRQAVIGDAKLTLQALAEELSRRGGGGRKNQALLDEIRTAKDAFLAKFRPWMESSETPINPYRVIGDLMKVLDPKASFVTADSGNTRDQTSTVYEAQIPRGHLGWGNVSTLGFSLAGAIGAKLAYPNRQVVNITGDAGVCYMMGNFEACARYGIGLTTLHINNGGYSGYGPGFWGGGHDPFTWKVSEHGNACMATMARAVGFHAEDVTQPSEIIPALKRALDENARGRPAYVEFIAPITRFTAAGCGPPPRRARGLGRGAPPPSEPPPCTLRRQSRRSNAGVGRRRRERAPFPERIASVRVTSSPGWRGRRPARSRSAGRSGRAPSRAVAGRSRIWLRSRSGRTRTMASTSSRSRPRPASTFMATRSSADATGMRAPPISRSSARARNCSSSPGPASTTSTGIRERRWTKGSTRVASTNPATSGTRRSNPARVSASTSTALECGPRLHGDIDIGGEPGHAVEHGGLGSEQEPAKAEGGEGPPELGQQLSDGRWRERHPRRGRWRASGRRDEPGPPGAPRPTASRGGAGACGPTAPGTPRMSPPDRAPPARAPSARA